MSVADAVASYVGRGYAPVPNRRGTKRPFVEDWQNRRLGLADIPTYWRNGENVGIGLGEQSGNLVDVDLDCPEALAAALAFLPNTTAIFGRKSNPRSHWLYVADPLTETVKFRDPTLPRDEATVAELRSTGAQTVFPPSVHNGETVEWSAEGEPSAVDGRILRQSVERLAACALVARHWPGQGSRHDAALALAGTLLRADWLVEDAEAFIGTAAGIAGDDEVRDRVMTVKTTAARLAEEQNATGIPTLAELIDPRVVDKIVEWLDLVPRLRVGGGERKSGPSDFSQDDEPEDVAWSEPLAFTSYEVPTFPTRAHPSWLGAYVDALAESLQVPVDVPALVALAVLSTACAKRVKVAVRDGWEEPVNLYVVASLPPGERKTAVYQGLTAPLAEYQESLARQFGPEIAEADNRRKIAEASLAKLRQDAVRARGSDRDQIVADADQVARELAESEVRVVPRLMAEDSTPERLTSLLAAHGGRIAVLSDEGDVFDLMAGRYSSNGTPNFSIFLKGHSGSDYLVDRVGRPSEHIKAPALTLGLTVQPDVIAALSSKSGFRGRGLLARFLYAVPTSKIGHRDDNPLAVPPPVRDEYRARILGLLALPETPEARCLWLSPEAAEVFTAFRLWLEPELGDNGALFPIRDWGGKLAGAVARIAGLLHMAEYAGDPVPWDQPIGDHTMAGAVEIGRYLIVHARAAFATMGADEGMESAKYLLAWLRRNAAPTFSKRDAYQGCRARFQRVESLDDPLRLLVEHGYIREQQPPKKAGPGRRASPQYAVHPSVAEAGKGGEEPW